MSFQKIRCSKIALTTLIPVAMTYLHLMTLSTRQSLVLGLLIMVIIWWVTGIVNQTIASIVLLCGFLVVSDVSSTVIFTFPLSENFLLISISFLFSQGVMNSGLAERFLNPLLDRFADTVPKLLLCMIACSGVTALFVPQSISRTLIVTSLFLQYFQRLQISKRTSHVLLFGLFFTGIFAGLLFPRGDIVLNYSLMSISGIEISDLEWIYYMAVPTSLVLILACVLYMLVFRKELKEYHVERKQGEEVIALSTGEKKNLVIIVATVVLWALEPLHGIRGTCVVLIGTIFMFLTRLLKAKDMKAVDLKVLIFLTAAFSIGGVITNSGIASQLFGDLGKILPTEFSWKYALILLLCTMIMHMVLGSNVGTLAVAIPVLMTVSADNAQVPTLIVLFLVYVAISQHFILPFHHVTLAIGVGKGYFTAAQVIRFGIPLTVLVLMGAVFIYMNWWGLIGVI